MIKVAERSYKGVPLQQRFFRTRAGLFIGGLFVPKHRNVLALVRNVKTGIGQLHAASNIVTDAGDVHYAERGAAETPTNAFGVMIMCTAGTPGKAATDDSFTAIAASEKAIDATYPKTNDGDSDNTGAGVDVVTWRTSWTTSDFNNGAITHGIITNATPGVAEPILTGYAFAASFAKTADDTLKVIVNHTMNGV